jgi:hypothetical protein
MIIECGSNRRAIVYTMKVRPTRLITYKAAEHVIVSFLSEGENHGTLRQLWIAIKF